MKGSAAGRPAPQRHVPASVRTAMAPQSGHRTQAAFMRCADQTPVAPPAANPGPQKRSAASAWAPPA